MKAKKRRRRTTKHTTRVSHDDPPKSFPSRFIDNNIDAKGQHFELLSFGSGRRICPGLNGDDFCGVLSGESVVSFSLELPERMVVEDVDMEEAPELTVSKKSELLLVPLGRVSMLMYSSFVTARHVVQSVYKHVDMEEAPELTVSKKSELLLVPQDMLCKVFINVIRHSRLRPLLGSDLFLAKVADVHTEKFVSH
ncbi:hypothetical protein F2Q69_00041166 [Brassica cretica]|uniref:Uncharacterized protein n=1 Tax=Brassica cretica TaxID=69181 RepID=A0A8S9NLV4_BRACR|nr:hypothetical protein F2Q69_00041166 [Brassica cretica]